MEINNLNITAIDPDKAEAGVWVDYDDGIEFLIARADTPGYRTALRRVNKQYKRQIETDSLSDSKSIKIMAGVMADHILLGWKGLKSGDDDVKYSREAAISILSNPRYTELREWIMAQANNLENFREEQVKK